VDGERITRGRDADGEMHGHAVRRLAETSPFLLPARREDYWPVSDEDLAGWQRRFEEANTPAAIARHNRREMRRLLTRRTRLRLWRRKQLTAAGVWLMEHGHAGACEALCGALRDCWGREHDPHRHQG
jgi:hypothetical protein